MCFVLPLNFHVLDSILYFRCLVSGEYEWCILFLLNFQTLDSLLHLIWLVSEEYEWCILFFLLNFHALNSLLYFRCLVSEEYDWCVLFFLNFHTLDTPSRLVSTQSMMKCRRALLFLLNLHVPDSLFHFTCLVSGEYEWCDVALLLNFNVLNSLHFITRSVNPPKLTCTRLPPSLLDSFLESMTDCRLALFVLNSPTPCT